MANAFLYPHAIQVTRPQGPSSDVLSPEFGIRLGKQPYQGVRRDLETLLIADVPASIQYAATGRAKGADLPSDTPSLVVWRVLTPRGYVAKGVLTERDVVTDEIGRRFQIIAAYWTSMGLSMRATLLQA